MQLFQLHKHIQTVTHPEIINWTKCNRQSEYPMRRHWVVSVEHTSVLRKAKSQKSIQSLLSLHISHMWCSISSHSWHFCASALNNLLYTHEPWCQHLERKHTQYHLHDKGWLHSCSWRCKSITACTVILLLWSRAVTKKTTVRSTPVSVSQRSNRTITSLHAFQSAAFTICHSVIQLFAHRAQSY
jgi:hypothetical protein